jgi:trehalose 6-phosphate synthase
VDILEGLLGSTILGFHTRFHCNNFIDTVDRFIESRIDRELASITLAGRETFIRPYPIAIEWPPAAMKNQAPVEQTRHAVRVRYEISANVSIAIGVERFDYTKGILDRMHAVDSFLSNHPEWNEKFVLLQIAAPTRSELSTYRHLQKEAKELADEINARYQIGLWKPIILIAEHHEPHQVFELFRAADICIVSSLHDGMNLVAKEFVASRDDEGGVLVLSSFAGASRELSEAILVNPYDPHSMGVALHSALLMSKSEQGQRMRVMRDHIRTRNVYRWAGKMLLDAEQLRKKQRILQIAAAHASSQ